MDEKHTSIEVGRAALTIAITKNRMDEQKVKDELKAEGIRATAVDFGGEFISSIMKIVERSVVAAQRQGLVSNTHVGAGAVAGACHEALEQLKVKALGFNVGGKIGIARFDEHLCVAIFMGVGVLNLNELCVGMAHRSLDKVE
ncbi:MAG TPA: HutP family protein [Candidatus Avacidaminococcus intestinavium]|uniref:Hut operon positive regulatory protein n=1 Tax=Candidatus Avacidaminococcus intestinavium TaxID=2840684 RepID=A0A9D1SLP8_9FIRM|nr:HutP family protein [Candidatus Avacidaminococcus intestinavium]